MPPTFSDLEYKRLRLSFLLLLPALSIAPFFTDSGGLFFIVPVSLFVALSLISFAFLRLQYHQKNAFGFFSIAPILVVLFGILYLTRAAGHQFLFEGFDSDFYFTYVLLVLFFLYLSPSLYVLFRTLNATPSRSTRFVFLCVVALLVITIGYVAEQKVSLSKEENWKVITGCEFTLKVPPSIAKPYSGCPKIFLWNNQGKIDIDVYETRSRSLSEWINNEWINARYTSFGPYFTGYTDKNWPEIFKTKLNDLMKEKMDRSIDGEIAYQFPEVPHGVDKARSLFTYHNGKVVRIYCLYADPDFNATCSEIIDGMQWNK